MSEQLERPAEILLVEDNPADIRFFQEVLKEGKILNRLNIVEEGAEALAYLRGEGEYKRRPRPDLVFLDLDLPQMDGRELLTEMRLDRSLQEVPVVVLTSSLSESDITHSFDLEAASYLTKPLSLKKLLRIVEDVAPIGMAFMVRRSQ